MTEYFYVCTFHILQLPAVEQLSLTKAANSSTDPNGRKINQHLIVVHKKGNRTGFFYGQQWLSQTSPDSCLFPMLASWSTV